MSTIQRENFQAWLNVMTSFYDQVDAEVKVRADQLPLHCYKGCAHCCIDELTVFHCEAAHIWHHCNQQLKALEPAAEGRCAMLDTSSNTCRIYPYRPYVCRSHGLVLQWHDEKMGLQRTSCELNVQIDISAVSDELIWPLGPAESQLARIEAHFFSHYHGERISLRSLITSKSYNADLIQ